VAITKIVFLSDAGESCPCEKSLLYNRGGSCSSKDNGRNLEMTKTRIEKKYIYLGKRSIYGIYYRANNTIYYNLDFEEKTKIIVLK
jgi:hypothetical protein